MNMKIPITLTVIAFWALNPVLGQVQTQSADSSKNTGFATEGANILYLVGNLEPNGVGAGYSYFVADKLSLGLELNVGTVLYSYTTYTTYQYPWSPQIYTRWEDHYYSRTFIQP